MTRFVRQSIRAAEQLVVNDVLPVVFYVERQMVGAIRTHLDQLEPDSTSAPEVHPQSDPTELLQSLLDRSIFNSPEDSRNELYCVLLGALVPDEVRILAALSDGSGYPVVHIAEPGAGPGSSADIVLENASNVGRSAGVSLPEFVPIYLARLSRMGLIAIGPEGPASMEDEYEMLLIDDAVSVAQAKARRGIRGARVMKRTVTITALGKETWEAAK